MKIVKRLPAHEILKILENQWLTTKDIKNIACVGYTKASYIKNEIELKIKEKDKNYFLPSGLVPCKEVVEYLNLDIKYLKKIANDGKEI